jgi:hypothetical protein
MHQRPLNRFAVALFLIALPVSADAPFEGADRQYDLFTDADTQIVDRFTRLEWSRPRSPTYPAAVNFQDAQTRCTNEGRRLPSLKELLSLVDEEPHLEYEGTETASKMIDRRAFSKTPTTNDFWTSSVRLNGKIATVSFMTGVTSEATPTDQRWVRCVRALP